MNNNFTVEEINLISIYNTGTRRELIEDMTTALPFMENDMRELAGQTLKKLNALTDDEYLQLAIDPAEDGDG